MGNRREELQYIKGMLGILAEIADRNLNELKTKTITNPSERAGYAIGGLKSLYKDVVAVLGYIDEIL